MLSTAALIVRLRRASGVERQQLKWFTFAMALTATLLVGSSIPGAIVSAELIAESTLRPVADALWIAAVSSLALLPLAAALAVFRYRLYDIDVLIDRTLVYGAVTGVLGTAHVGSVLLLQALLRPFTGGSQFAVAISTLVVVALFRPVRRRIKDAVDQRFYRSRYDAERTLDAFAGRLRDEVDLDELEHELVGAVTATMRPAHASLWLRDARR